MISFEVCPFCNGREGHVDKLKPMVLCGNDTEMQCDICKGIYKLPDCEAIKEIARIKRRERYEGTKVVHGN